MDDTSVLALLSQNLLLIIISRFITKHRAISEQMDIIDVSFWSKCT